VRSKEELVREYYSKLKKLPAFRLIAGLGVAETLMVWIRSMALGTEFLEAALLYLALGIALYFKQVKFAVFAYDASMFFYLIMSLTPLQPIYALGILLPLIGYVVVAYYKEWYTYFVMLVQGGLPSIFYGFMPEYIAYIVLITASFAAYIHLVNLKALSFHGFKSLEVLRPFITGSIRKDYSLVDSFLSLSGVKTDVIVTLFKLGDKVLVVPKLHFGLFGEAGSSRFLYDLEERCNECTAFHGPGSHELDAVSRSESLKVVNSVVDFIRRGEWKEEKFYGVNFWQKGRMSGITLLFQGKSLTFLARPGFGIDDLPESLWNYSYGTGNYLIDTHSEVLKVDIDRKDVEDVKEALSSLKRENERPLYFAYKEAALPDSEDCPGLCNKKVKVFAVSDGEKRVGIVYVYANNSHECLAKAISQVEGYDRVILVTPDDHTCTGTFLGSLYEPARSCRILVEESRRLLKEALAELRPVKAYSGIVKVSDVKVLGDLVSQMMSSLEFVGSFVKKTYWIPLVVPYLALITLVLFQTFRLVP